MLNKKLMYKICVIIGVVSSLVDIDFSPSFTNSQILFVVVKFLGISILIIGLMGLPNNEGIFGIWSKKKK